ncbi:uncharacterized protein FIBRA_01639 [Fibroporia radiculosa]|uniref:CDP-diacylglycerol--glycerol-3-phosphate 3-phosphatidyltransferase n=1 Tax=Fibroporia radiculosa TaxID=599839 RepID=J4GKV3_9APHY|nr:uncharacterized protein FIBRA_01639 [Fibroporia radiculosa]CCL99620.1 predicted protein [Fibroporia radiculosa]
MPVTASWSRTLLQQYGHTKLARLRLRGSRSLSTAVTDPAIRQFICRLGEHQPCYGVASSSIRIMSQPQDFYQCLLNMIQRARQRIFISSLYIGSEDFELIDTLRASLQANPLLRVQMHLDYNRCTRPEPLSTANLLVPLLKEFPDRVRVWLFRSPKLKGLLAKLMPPRFNEGWGGTWHPKIYGADDELLISGANLNTSYFTNRQDRYIHFTDQAPLAQYCLSFLDQAATFSYSLLPSSSTSGDYVLDWPDQRTHPHHFESKAQAALTAFQDRSRKSSISKVTSVMSGVQQGEKSKADTLVFPIIQAGQFSVREEERCLSLLFRQVSGTESQTPGNTGHMIDLTSGYFGLYKPYQDLIIGSQLACRVLAASPKANGFYGSRGVSGRVPEGYTVLERQFMRAVNTAKRDWTHDQHTGEHSGVQLNEWERDGWTYHAKGIWLRPTPSADPSVTLFGSTNLNSRSANLDTELSFLLVTNASALRSRLAEELNDLRAYAHPWKGAERKVRLGSWILARALQDRL